jgi:hypothetical protein
MSEEGPGLPRWFPLPSAEMYDEVPAAATAPGERLARGLLALTKEEPSWRERLLGRAGAGKRVARLLRLHRLALVAELAARWERADFYWCELREERKRLGRRSAAWDLALAGAARQSGEAGEATADELRSRLMQEVLIETHWAFYGGLSRGEERPATGDRRFVHVAAIEGLLDDSPWPKQRQQAAFGPLLEAWARSALAAGSRDLAVDVAARLLARYPHVFRYEELLVEAEVARTLGGLNNRDDQSGSQADAAVLERGIARLEQLRSQSRYNADLYQALGLLEHLHAVKLANAGRLAVALLAIEKSLTYRPGVKEVLEARTKLQTMMHSLQERMRAVEAAIAKQYNTSLNAAGQRMRAEALAGTGPAASYRQSLEAGAIGAALPLAAARTLWRQIGLPVPESRWDERARALFNALSKVRIENAADPAAVAAAWNGIAARDQELHGLEAALICAFIRNRLLDLPPPADAAPAPPSLLVPSSRLSAGGSEPFGDWLTSRRGLALRTLAALAVALLAVAGPLTFRDRWRQHTQGRAWAELRQAIEHHDDLGVVAAAESFLGTPAPAGADPGRQAVVLEVYSRALVRWFARLPGAPDAAALRHLERFRALAAGGAARGDRS